MRSDQLPGVGDGVFFEVVAERKIAQHLEERVMAVGESDVFEIVMFAAGADAFLRGCSAFVVARFEAEEDVLELVHARVGEEQRGIVGRNERRGMDLFMSVLDEIVQKFAPNLGAGQHEMWRNRVILILASSPIASGQRKMKFDETIRSRVQYILLMLGTFLV